MKCCLLDISLQQKLVGEWHVSLVTWPQRPSSRKFRKEHGLSRIVSINTLSKDIIPIPGYPILLYLKELLFSVVTFLLFAIPSFSFSSFPSYSSSSPNSARYTAAISSITTSLTSFHSPCSPPATGFKSGKRSIVVISNRSAAHFPR